MAMAVVVASMMPRVAAATAVQSTEVNILFPGLHRHDAQQDLIE